MAELYHYTFATNLGEFSTTTASNGTIEQSAGAGLNGTTGGVLITRTGASPSIYGVVPFNGTGLTAMRFAFFADWSSYGITTNNQTGLVWSPRTGAAGATTGSIVIARVSDVLYLRLRAHDDEIVVVQEDVSMAMLPAWIEAEFVREASNGSNDGAVRYYFGGGDYPDAGEMVAEFTGQGNYTVFLAAETLRLGMVSGFSGVFGTVKLDEMRFRNDNTPILYGVTADSGRPYDLDQLTDLTTIRM